MARYRHSPNYIAKKSLWPALRWWNVIFFMILIPAALIVLQLMKVDLPTLGELKEKDEVVIAAPMTEKSEESNLLSSTQNADHKNTSVTYNPTDFSKVTDSERYVVKAHSDGTFTFAFKGQDEKFLSMEDVDKKLSLNEAGINGKWNLMAKPDAENVFYLQNAARKSYLAWNKGTNSWDTVFDVTSDCIEVSFYTLNGDGAAVALNELKGGEEVIVIASAYGKVLSATKTNAGGNVGVDYNAADLTNITDAEKFTVTKNSDGSFAFNSKTGKKLAMENEDKRIAIVDNGINNKWALVPKEGATNVFYVKNVGRECYLEFNKANGVWQVTDASKPTQQFEVSFYDATAKVMSQLETYSLLILIALSVILLLTIICHKSLKCVKCRDCVDCKNCEKGKEGRRGKTVAALIFIFLVVVCVAVCLLLAPVGELFSKFVLGNGWVILGLWCLVPLIFWLTNIIILTHDYFEFYDTYVIERYGVFVKRTKKTVFPEITTLWTKKKFLLGYGDVHIDVVGPWDIDFLLDIRRPDDLRDYLEYHMINNAAVENISNNPYIAATDGIF